jgi:hypothetical protein
MNRKQIIEIKGMRKISLVVLILLLFPNISHAQQYGFKDVLFGDSFDTAWDKLNKQGIIFQSDDFGKKLSRDTRNIICVTPIGSVKMVVMLYFDDQMKFFMFDMRYGGATDVNGLDNVVKSQVEYLLELFKSKYGKPTKCFSYPNVAELEALSITPVCIWSNKKITAKVGVYETDEATFDGKASVTDNKLIEDYIKRKKIKNKKGAKSGVKDF